MANTAQEMVEKLRLALNQNVGVDSISVDGQSVKYNRAQLLAELDYWERAAAKARGRRPLFKGFDLGSAWDGGITTTDPEA